MSSRASLSQYIYIVSASFPLQASASAAAAGRAMRFIGFREFRWHLLRTKLTPLLSLPVCRLSYIYIYVYSCPKWSGRGCISRATSSGIAICGSQRDRMRIAQARIFLQMRIERECALSDSHGIQYFLLTRDVYVALE